MKDNIINNNNFDSKSRIKYNKNNNLENKNSLNNKNNFENEKNILQIQNINPNNENNLNNNNYNNIVVSRNMHINVKEEEIKDSNILNIS